MDIQFSKDTYTSGCKYLPISDLHNHPKNFRSCSVATHGAFLVKDFEFKKGEIIKDLKGKDWCGIKESSQIAYFTFQGYRCAVNSENVFYVK